MEIEPSIPRVGIALAVYRPNIVDFCAQLKSIRNQSYTNWFCVLTADSPLAELGNQPELKDFFDDSRFFWNENPARLGFKHNFSHAMQIVLEKGARYIACSDQDDLWYQEKLETCVKAIVTKPAMSIVHSDMDLIVDGKPWPESAWAVEKRGIHNVSPSYFFIRNVATGASMLMDSELARKYPIIPDNIEFHDYWYALVASFHGGVHPIPKRLYAYRQHRENVVGIVAYLGLLGASSWKSWFQLPQRSKKAWRKTRDLAMNCEKLGLPLTPAQKFTFLWPYDLGVGLFAFGIKSVFTDRPVARDCFIRSLGKFFTAIGC
jgi:hypothetical protein